MKSYRAQFCFWVFLFFLWSLSSCRWGGRVEPAQSMFIDDIWQFTTGDDMAYADPYYYDDGWSPISSDRSWEQQGYPDYNGFAWYRKTIQLPEFIRRKSESGGGLLLSLGVIHDADMVFVNGKKVGSSGEFPPDYKTGSGDRLYLVPHSFWRFGAENTIAIRVYNDSGIGGIIADSIDLRTVTLIDQMKVSGKVYNDLGVFPRNDSVKVNVSVINHSSRVARVNLVIEAETDAGLPAYSEVWPFTLYPAKSIQYTYAHLPETPGFYRYMVYLEKDGIRGTVHRFMVGYDPENIPSAPDIIPDLSSFWGKALQDLSAVTPAYRVSLLPGFSSP
ncbi:MAG: hypothetical protein PHS48_06850, partial [Bacteroidales bacterium]|nr:hypothetical protein [Bacteroidales bacterium]